MQIFPFSRFPSFLPLCYTLWWKKIFLFLFILYLGVKGIQTMKAVKTMKYSMGFVFNLREVYTEMDHLFSHIHKTILR